MAEDNTIWIALIVAVVGPVLLSWLQGRQRRAEKDQDYERQDAVADRLVAANERVAAQAAQAAQATNGKLDVIHTLVDGAMTEAMRSELDATQRELVMMKEVVALKEASGQEHSMESTAVIRATQAKIDELEANLQARLRQVRLAEDQEADQQARRDELAERGE